MTTNVQGVPTVCTAYQICSFAYNGGVNVAELRDELISHLNMSRSHLKVCVFALLTMQQSDNFPVLEELGFVKTFDANNYKYPDTSKRLVMFTKDMNGWKPPAKKAPEKSANPFHVTASGARPGDTVTPEPIPVATPRGDAPVVVLQDAVTSQGAIYHTRRVSGVLRRISLQGWLYGEFPVGQWVDVPRQPGRGGLCPFQLRGQRVILQLRNGNYVRGTADSFIWTTRNVPDDIVRVKRLA